MTKNFSKLMIDTKSQIQELKEYQAGLKNKQTKNLNPGISCSYCRKSKTKKESWKKARSQREKKHISSRRTRTSMRMKYVKYWTKITNLEFYLQ